jgi:hypothetical protein
MKWLVGEWSAEDRGSKIKLACQLDLGGKYLRMDFTVTGANEPLNIVQYVGWDPTEGLSRSWTFDSRGGFGQAVWTRTGGIWRADAEGVLPGGQTGSAVNFVRMNGPTSFTWQSTEREVDGQPIPDHEIKYTRANAAP